MTEREEYRALMRRMFVERNVATVYNALVTNPQRTGPRPSGSEAVAEAGELWDAITRKYGHGTEPHFLDGGGE